MAWKDIVTEEDGSLWISMSRQKTDIPFNVKLLDIPVRIIEKYKGITGTGKDDPVFEVLSHRRVSDALKTVAKHCNIETNLTFHTARHTFATYLLSKGVSIESVSKILGHTNIKTTQTYARILDTKVSDDMAQFAEKIKGIENIMVSNL